MMSPVGHHPALAMRITFDGAAIDGREGELLASTLLRAGNFAISRGRAEVARGPFCGMGICHDCLVTIDGVTSQRACMVKSRDGMVVARQSSAHVPLAEHMFDNKTVQSSCDVLIVGAGAAGLATALACGPGLSLRVIDDRPSPGGQYFKQGPGDRQAREGAALLARVADAGVAVTSGATVWGAFRDEQGGLEVGVATRDGVELIRPRYLVVATGAYERPLMVPGWTLPGVMTIGACQTFLRADGVVPAGRILIAGNGPLGLQLAWALLDRGAEVAAVALSAPPPWQRPAALWDGWRADPGLMATGLGYLIALRRRGVPLYYRHVLTRVDGAASVEAATLAPLADDATIQHVRARAFAVDTVCMGYGFLPSNELPRLLGCAHRPSATSPGLETLCDEAGQTSQRDVFVVGEAARIGGARVALAQSRLAGARLRQSSGLPAGTTTAAARTLRRHQAFQSALGRMFAAPDPGLAVANAETILCRCENVTLKHLTSVIATQAVTDAASLKRATRAGMGRCQGRYCSSALDALLHQAAPPDEMRLFAPQVPLRPLPAGLLAEEAPEWLGHRRMELPAREARPATVQTLPEVDTAVIGAGIVGLSCALYLARAGHAVAVLDRGEPCAEASGGNAGSLHGQLLSFDATGASSVAAARTLGLQRDGVALWAELERELGADFEVRSGGGLMVAETEADLARLRGKTALEQECGVEVELIGPEALYQLEPRLMRGLLGAAHCPGEGRINPLAANLAILQAARAAGARLLPNTEVRAISRDGTGFLLTTQSGTIRAGRIVNAAGAWAARIAEMLGASIPVFGAPLQMIVTEPAEPGLSRLLAHASRHLTIKQAGTGAFLIGGGWTAGLDPVHGRPRPLRGSLGGNLFVACRLLPCLAALQIVRSWAAMNIDIDGAPILGQHPGLPGLFHAVGANGYTLGPLLGQIAARCILHGDPGRDIAEFGAARFSG